LAQNLEQEAQVEVQVVLVVVPAAAVVVLAVAAVVVLVVVADILEVVWAAPVAEPVQVSVVFLRVLAEADKRLWMPKLCLKV
jgi:hypothetical protein